MSHEPYHFSIDEQKFIAQPSPAGFQVKSSRSPYSVIFSEDVVPIQAVAQALNKNPRNVLLIDARVHQLFAKYLQWPSAQVLKLEVSEKIKSIDGFLQIVEFLDRNAVAKADHLVIVGGGVIEDVGSFAAGVYKRGVPWIFFPTTLLAQCDSCIGGKTNLNHGGVKNLIGTVTPPAQVVVNRDFLSTLEQIDLLSGFGEILKSHVIAGPTAFAQLESNPPQALGPELNRQIANCLAIKKSIIEFDEFESGTRRALNYGHTLGHALESASQNQIPHGVAVTLGILLENRLSEKRGFLARSTAARIEHLALKLVDAKSLELFAQIEFAGLAEWLQKDKKSSDAGIGFVFLKELGELFFTRVACDQQLIQDLRAAQNGVLKALRL